jgi:hypothetical protein
MGAVNSQTLRVGVALLIAAIFALLMLLLIRMRALERELDRANAQLKVLSAPALERHRDRIQRIETSTAVDDRAALERVVGETISEVEAVLDDPGVGSTDPRPPTPLELASRELATAGDAGLEAVLALIERRPEPAARRLALGVIGRCGDARALPALERLADRVARGEAPELSGALAEAIGGMLRRRVERAYPLALRLALASELPNRHALALPMAESGDPELASGLRSALATDPSVSMRSHAAQALGECPRPDEAITAALRRALDADAMPPIRRNAARSLAQRSARLGTPPRGELIEWLGTRYATEPDEGARAVYVRLALDADREAAAALAARAATDDSAAVRRQLEPR